jgi:hypothetical protein
MIRLALAAIRTGRKGWLTMQRLALTAILRAGTAAAMSSRALSIVARTGREAYSTLALILWGLGGWAHAQMTPAQALARVGEEAAVFQENLPKSIAQETLTQHARLAASRYIALGPRGVATPPKPRVVSHEVVSEYSVGHLKNSDSQNLFEFRQVVSVDGKAVRSAESARRELTMGIRSQDDSVRKRMLQDYAKFGLVDVATDYGLILLAFTKRGLETMQVKAAGESRIGADAAMALAWKQVSADAGELEFRGRQAVRQALQGTLWVRASDGLPLRIQAWAEYEQSKHKIRDEASVEYAMSAHGFLTPASVVHRHIVDGQIMTENLYRYEGFRLFSSDSELKFTEAPDVAPDAPVKSPATSPIKK